MVPATVADLTAKPHEHVSLEVKDHDVIVVEIGHHHHKKKAV